MLIRMLDRISRPISRRNQRRRERLHAIVLAQTLALSLLAAISLCGMITFGLLTLAPQALTNAEKLWRWVHWLPLQSSIANLDSTIASGDERAAIRAADDLFGYGASNVKVLDHGYEQFLQALTRAMRSPFASLRRKAAEASIAHHDYDSLAWLTLAGEKTASGDKQGAEGAYLKALAMRPYWPHAREGLRRLYDEAGRAPDAEAVLRAASRATFSLMGAGVPVHIVLETPNGGTTTRLQWLDNCHPHVIRMEIPPRTRNGYLVVPGADGIAIGLHRLESIPAAGDPSQPWLIIGTSHLDQTSPKRFITRISPDTPEDTAPSISFQATVADPGRALELEIETCIAPSLATELGQRGQATLTLVGSRGEQDTHRFDLDDCRPLEIVRFIAAGTTEVRIQINRDFGFLRLRRHGGDALGHDIASIRQLRKVATGSYAIETSVVTGTKDDPSVILYRGAPLAEGRLLVSTITWCDLDVVSAKGDGS